MKPDYLTSFLKGIFLLQIFVLILIAGVSLNVIWYPQQLTGLHLSRLAGPISINREQATLLLCAGNYALAGGGDNFITSVQHYYREVAPGVILAANMQALGYNSSEIKPEQPKAPASVTAPTESSSQADANRNLFGERKVVCYCTHSAESYIPDSGVAKTEGKRGLVNEVARTLIEAIEGQGVKGEYINTIHDFPDYNKSYTNSRKTVNNILSSGNVLALFDVHRDSIPGETRGSGVQIGNGKAARILIIVGTNQRKYHPHWHENLQFAQELYAKAEKMYPGLIKGVETKAGTYNQEFFNHALLLEFGSDKNSLAEAEYAAQLFSRVVVEVLKEESNAQ